MDGLHNKAQPKCKRQKKCGSKFLKRLFYCLDNKRHTHMLYYSNSEKSTFKVHLKNKKSRTWIAKDISLFIELDTLSNKKRSKKSYEEKCKGRFKSNMRKCSKYIKEISSEKLSTELTLKEYDILRKPQNTVNTLVNGIKKSEEKIQNQHQNGSVNKNDLKVENYTRKTQLEQKIETVSHFSCLSPKEIKIPISSSESFENVEKKILQNIVSETIKDIPISSSDSFGNHEEILQYNLGSETIKDAMINMNDVGIDVKRNKFQNIIIRSKQNNLLNNDLYMDIEENNFAKNIIGDFKNVNVVNYFSDIQSFDKNDVFQGSYFNELEYGNTLYGCGINTITDEYGNAKAQIDSNECLNDDPFLCCTDELDLENENFKIGYID